MKRYKNILVVFLFSLNGFFTTLRKYLEPELSVLEIRIRQIKILQSFKKLSPSFWHYIIRSEVDNFLFLHWIRILLIRWVKCVGSELLATGLFYAILSFHGRIKQTIHVYTWEIYLSEKTMIYNEYILT